MALTPISTREPTVLVSLADPEVELLPGKQVNPLFVFKASAVVIEGEEATAGAGATRFTVRTLSDLELARISGQGDHLLHISAARSATTKIRKPRMSVDDVPYGVKYSIGQWAVAASQGLPLTCVDLKPEPKNEDVEDSDQPAPEEGAAAPPLSGS